ncbi:hypothetical protein EC843_1011019 [Buttiauxella sp. JUb87]|uniref:hypothetical protein n=1 Tax=Buttiauxella sp. JUb87 TaxID=2485129 RepID=UPI00105DE2A0|nr:hypothetical protein [Buttiauxella sp. JUb87]TDN54960.1 hypothetical protein EC843_1011019 [Buttiauxella sp. JUb87]
MTVKRYDFYYNDDFGAEFSAFQNENSDGEYVSHEDYAALLKERDALVAENVGLKKFCKSAAFDADYEAELCMERGGFTDALNDIKTQATDAAIANVQAQGVDMFVAHIDYPHSPVDFTHGYVDELAKAFASQLRKESTHD